jgi:hypothetical protein
MGARCSLSDFGSRQRSLRATGLPPVGSQHALHAVAVASLRQRGDADQQYFADGITEDLTTDLSRIANMFVILSNTASTYRNKPIDTKQIGHELGVRYVLEGSVQRSGNRIAGGNGIRTPGPRSQTGALGERQRGVWCELAEAMPVRTVRMSAPPARRRRVEGWDLESRERRIREIDRDRVVQDPAYSRGRQRPARNNLGNLYRDTGRPAEADKATQRGARHLPGSLIESCSWPPSCGGPDCPLRASLVAAAILQGLNHASAGQSTR